jgi:hypothetical protein
MVPAKIYCVLLMHDASLGHESLRVEHRAAPASPRITSLE